jgi:hypothetical protein
VKFDLVDNNGGGFGVYDLEETIEGGFEEPKWCFNNFVDEDDGCSGSLFDTYFEAVWSSSSSSSSSFSPSGSFYPFSSSSLSSSSSSLFSPDFPCAEEITFNQQ